MTRQYETEAAIRAKLTGTAADFPVTVYDSVTSTNDILRTAAADGAPEGTVILARQQTAGRGRQGRAFFSPPQTGLYLSMLLRPEMCAETVLSVTPMAAVAAAEAAEQCTGRRVQIKWVNDLLLDGKKICGILAESQFSAQTGKPDFVVLGIGFDLLEPPAGYPPELKDIAGALFPPETDPEAAFTDCAAALIKALAEEYAGLAQKRYLAAYRERLCVLHRPVTVLENGKERRAEALAVDDNLRLLVRYADGTEQWRSTGEIRIRL